MNHPDVEHTMLTGYPDRSHLTYEDRQWSAVDHSVIADHPVEDYFGDEIQTGDKYFTDEAGRIVLQDNIRDYLTELAGAVFYKAK
ncbi:YqaI family protein [Edaphobacillus lindanitolerans]|uniref:YqaI-like protein n=1 Tax=Edaphobacillus lindanitolerans TaxID=550447 RepID=A0A1U7PQL7_9BACI|nr:hypothetical protein [Edaphobacillus lindanitolerans]SIT91525.1 Hypothetical protein Yqai [Edaphobacillus lindanitolerans]